MKPAKPLWQQQLKKALQQTAAHPLMAANNYAESAAQMFSPVVTDVMLQQAQLQQPEDPVLRQFLPDALETVETEGLKADPVGDLAATQVPGLIHKYHGRVLLIASGSCAVNCRYCFRRHFAYSQNFAPRHGWQASIDYIKQHDSIHEVILSGGDPLTIDTKILATLTTALQPMAHVKTLRIHSRIPVVLPSRIDADFLTWAETWSGPKVMVLHVNHSQELSTAAETAIKALQQAGFRLMNQSVLLRGINDDANTLAALSNCLFELGVMPYYLHQMDPVQNAEHFRVPTDQALKIHQQLKTLLPGYLVPKLVKEVPGDAYKQGLAC